MPKCAVCMLILGDDEFPLLAHVESSPDCGISENERKLKAELRVANFQIEAWRPVVEAAKGIRKKERWPYLNMEPLARALDTLEASEKLADVQPLI